MLRHQPTAHTKTAARNAQKRLLAELKDKTGVDATRQRRAVNSIFNIVSRFVDGDLTRQAERPASVERNATTAIERKVGRYWAATEHLMDWMFNAQTILTEQDAIGAFDAIV